jgi:hypothetical protein
VLQVEFMGPNLIQPIHHLVLEVFHLVLKGGDLCSKPVHRDLQVLDYPSLYIDFDLTSDSGNPFFV